MNNRIYFMNRRKMLILVLLVIAFQVSVMTVIYGNLKKGFYCDEMYSYGTANSGGTLTPLMENEEFVYVNKWFDGTRIKDYLVVNADEVFRYDLINKALRLDGHPPLYFYLLHLFSSFTIGKFSKWTGFILNAICFFILEIYLYRIALLLSKDRIMALIVMVFFGFTTGAVNIVTFIRMYCLLCAMTAMFSFYSLKYVDEVNNKKETGLTLILAFTSMVLVGLTQYQGIVFAFFLTLFECVYFLIKKKYKKMFSFGITMLGAVILVVILFPVVIRQLNEPQSPIDNSTLYPFLFQLRLSINHIMAELFGINTSVYPTMIGFWLFWTAILLAGLAITGDFLFRNDIWAQRLKYRFVTGIVMGIRSMEKSHNERSIFFLLSSATVCTLMAGSRFLQIYYYFPYSDRYMFVVYPFAFALLSLAAARLLKNKKLLIILCTLLLAMSIQSGRAYYLNRVAVIYPDLEIAAKDSDVVVVGLDPTAILNFSAALTDCHKCFVLTKNDYKDHLKELEDYDDSGRPVYMIMETSPLIEGLEDNPPEMIIEDIKRLSITTNFKDLASINTAHVYRLR